MNISKDCVRVVFVSMVPGGARRVVPREVIGQARITDNIKQTILRIFEFI